MRTNGQFQWEEVSEPSPPKPERSEEFLWPELHAAHLEELGPPPTPTLALHDFGLILSAVASLVDEEHLSNERALEAIRKMMRPGEQPRQVVESLLRLKSCSNELDFRVQLGQESLRAYGLSD